MLTKVTTHTHALSGPCCFRSHGFDRADRDLSLVAGRFPAANHKPPPIRAEGRERITFNGAFTGLLVCVCMCVCNIIHGISVCF